MGTHCTVKFKDNGKVILNVFYQYDGYPEWVGLNLAKWLKKKRIVHGYRSGEDKSKGYANGIGCLAAQYVTDFKKDIGGFYIVDPEETECYDYIVEFDGKKFIITFEDNDFGCDHNGIFSCENKNTVVYTLDEFIQKFQK